MMEEITYRKFGSVINLTPAHSKITVAVPTKNKLAFSAPFTLGCSLVSVASGSELGTVGAAWSRVGWRCLDGSSVRCWIGDDIVR